MNGNQADLTIRAETNTIRARRAAQGGERRRTKDEYEENAAQL
jgi:hypothetical protein